MSWQIPLFSTSFGPEEEEALLRPLRRAWLTMGEEVERLEAQMCRDTGARHAIAVSNCTAALHLVGASLGLGPGDEVLCPSLTFVASASALRATGASVKFCDIVGPDDWTLDPAAVEAAIGPATRAVVVVHYAGFPCRMEEIVAIARRHNLFVIEDCAHALYSRMGTSPADADHLGGRRSVGAKPASTERGPPAGRAGLTTLGLIGDAGCFSFYSNKNATCGEGGAILTQDDDLARRIRLLRSHGMTAPTMERHKGHAFSYDVISPGFNCRMDEMRAALMQVQLGRLPDAL
ncbi:MAG: DegT/DnrJ/EryC1/StrS family aminotransferase, partial [Verrucomicrobia bacterium]|nr:DegT/DnrJ/EryC1/StrS family aminotransferase [Verrucomicrobiota bacterium]